MRLALFAFLLTACVPAGSADAKTSYVCNMSALTKKERAIHLKASLRLFAYIQEQKELSNGYAFRMSPEALATAAQWVSLERKCCPFFAFAFELGPDEGPLWVRVTGSDGIKPFIRAEFGLGPE
jgi:hypothetical protein